MVSWPTTKTLTAVTAVAATLLVVTGQRSYSRLPSQHQPLASAAPVTRISPAPHATPRRVASARTSPKALTAVVQRYCAVCHNPQTNAGNLSLKDFDVAAATERPE